MVNLYSNFITCRDEANISDVAGKNTCVGYFGPAASHVLDCLTPPALPDHFDHLRQVIGAEFIGIGGDFEGVARYDMHPRNSPWRVKTSKSFSQFHSYNRLCVLFLRWAKKNGTKCIGKTFCFYNWWLKQYAAALQRPMVVKCTPSNFNELFSVFRCSTWSHGFFFRNYSIWAKSPNPQQTQWNWFWATRMRCHNSRPALYVKIIAHYENEPTSQKAVSFSTLSEAN